MTTWKEVEPEVLALLNDVDKTEYEPKNIIRWWNNAQIRLATQKPQPRHQIYKSDDGNPFNIPKLHYKPVAIFIKGINEPMARLSPELGLLNKSVVGFYIYENKVVMNGIQGCPPEWLYVYHSYFPKVKNHKSEVLVPEWAIEACVFYAGSQAMSSRAVDDAQYRQYTAPPDATGNPLHNPYLKVAEYFDKRYYAIVSQHTDDDEDFR